MWQLTSTVMALSKSHVRRQLQESREKRIDDACMLSRGASAYESTCTCDVNACDVHVHAMWCAFGVKACDVCE